MGIIHEHTSHFRVSLQQLEGLVGGLGGLLTATNSLGSVVSSVNGILKGPIDTITAAFGIINAADSAYRSLYNMIMTTKDILKELDLDAKKSMILIDKACPGVDLWLRCVSKKVWTEWHQIDDDEGYP
jgi:hypothetical protein